MPFSEAVKKKVKEMANFQCCKCFSVFVEVHHIIPEAQGGSNDIDNAVPLCPNCHSWFGGNPDLRKAIRHMRNFHYKNCEKQRIDRELLKKIQEDITKIKESKENEDEKVEKIASTVADRVIDRFSEIKDNESKGLYPDPHSFVDDMVTASGTATTVLKSIDIDWRDIKKILGAGGTVIIGGSTDEKNEAS